MLIPLAAAAFISVGRHPLAGLALGFASVAAAFLVNVLIVPTDAILTEITNDAIHLLDPNRSIDLAANVWFSIASVIMLTLLIGLINDHVVEPRLGRYERRRPDATARARCPRWSSAACASRCTGCSAVLAFIALLTLPPGAPLRNPETGAIIGNSPFMNSLIVSIALVFLVCGVAYGIGAGTLKGANDVIGAMQKAIGSLSGLILLLLVISQFLAFFNYTQHGDARRGLARRRAAAGQSGRALAAGRLHHRHLRARPGHHRRRSPNGRSSRRSSCRC